MKKHKKYVAMLTAALLAITPLAATGMTVFADSTNSITITAKNAGTHNYNAYQIFKGNLSGSGTTADPYVLTDIQWGDNVSGATFLSALKAADEFKIDDDNNASTPDVNAFESVTDAAGVAAVLEQYADNSDFAVKFAKFAGSNLKNGAAAKATDGTPDNSTGKYELVSLDAGYYLVKDEADTAQGTPRTLNLLKVAGNVDLTTKDPLPTLAKKITNANQNADGSANTASYGDIVDYQIKSNVPDMFGYEKYFFIVNDSMEKGLTFDPSSVSITIKNKDSSAVIKTLTSSDYYINTSTTETTNNFQIVFKNFIQYNTATYIGHDIFINYKATVNETATKGNTPADANTNTANLTYSNNPNVESTGIPADGSTPAKPDEPNPPSSPSDPSKPGDPVGNTPDQTTYTYLTDLVIEKVDKDNTNTKLSGAQFELTGESINATYHQGKLYKKSDTVAAADAYYLLTDGTYTSTAPGGTISNDKYVSTTQKYELITTAETINTTYKVTAYGTSGANGKITFSALGEGIYTILETQAPDGGYNKLLSPLTVTITATPSATGCTWTYNGTNSNIIQVKNAKGNPLPSTGGMGTKLFYFIGSLLVAGSLVLLITKKRMSKEN